MPNTENQVILTIVGVIVVLLFIGILFLVMVLYNNNKKVQLLNEQQSMKDMYEKQLLESKLEIQEQTFNFISQEIHDNVGQVLSLAKVQLNIMDQQQEMDKSMLKEVKESIGKAMSELRDMAKSLSTEKSQSFDLLDAVTNEVKRLNNTKLIKAVLLAEGSARFIIEQHRLIMFRLIQESMQNILKHAAASEVTISITSDNAKSLVVISDNGTGFDVENALQNNSGLGLRNIINRAKLIGGEATIQSSCNNGTTVTIILPSTHA